MPITRGEVLSTSARAPPGLSKIQKRGPAGRLAATLSVGRLAAGLAGGASPGRGVRPCEEAHPARTSAKARVRQRTRAPSPYDTRAAPRFRPELASVGQALASSGPMRHRNPPFPPEKAPELDEPERRALQPPRP